MNSLHVTGLHFFVWRFWLMKPPEGLTKGKDIFQGLFALQVQAGFPDQITHRATIPENFSTYLKRKDPLYPKIS